MNTHLRLTQGLEREGRKIKVPSFFGRKLYMIALLYSFYRGKIILGPASGRFACRIPEKRALRYFGDLFLFVFFCSLLELE